MRHYSLLLTLLTSPCIDRIDFDIPGNIALNLVVEDQVSNQQVPYQVKLRSGLHHKTTLLGRLDS